MAVTDMNVVALIGNLTRDPEEIAGGAGCKFSIAVNESFFSKAKNEREEYTSYIDVTVWGKAAEPVMKFCSKGSKVAVQGKLKQERWEKDGQRQSRVTVTALQTQFLTPKGQATGGSDIPVDTNDFATGGSTAPMDDDIPF